MPEASSRVAGGERRDTTGSSSQEGPHPGRGASAAAPKKPKSEEKASRANTPLPPNTIVNSRFQVELNDGGAATPKPQIKRSRPPIPA